MFFEYIAHVRERRGARPVEEVSSEWIMSRESEGQRVLALSKLRLLMSAELLRAACWPRKVEAHIYLLHLFVAFASTKNLYVAVWISYTLVDDAQGWGQQQGRPGLIGPKR